MPLVEGTLVTLKDKSTKHIEDLTLNDELVAFTINGLENIKSIKILQKQELLTFSGSFDESKIKNIRLDISSDIYQINDKLLLDAHHFVFIKRNDKYYWSEAQYCINNDLLFKIDNTWEAITKIEKIETKINVYNVIMNKIYNYFANEYLVHNGGNPCSSGNCGSDCGESAGEEEGEGGGKGKGK